MTVAWTCAYFYCHEVGTEGVVGLQGRCSLGQIHTLVMRVLLGSLQQALETQTQDLSWAQESF